MKAGTALQRRLVNENLNSLNSFAMKMQGDRNFIYVVNTICFAKFSYDYEGALAEFAMSLNHAMKRKYIDMKQYILFCNEVIKHSKFKHCFISRNASNADKYGINLRVDITPSELIAACIALRLGYEFSNSLTTYWMLRGKGLSVDTSLALCTFFDVEGSEMPNNNSNHYLFGALDEQILFNYLKNGLRIDPKAKLVSEGNRDYRIFYTTYSAPKNNRHGERYTTTFFNDCYSENVKKGNFGNVQLLDIDKIVEKAKAIEERVSKEA